MASQSTFNLDYDRITFRNETVNLISHDCHSYLHITLANGIPPRKAMVMAGENAATDVDEEVYGNDGNGGLLTSTERVTVPVVLADHPLLLSYSVVESLCYHCSLEEMLLKVLVWTLIKGSSKTLEYNGRSHRWKTRWPDTIVS